MADSYTSSSIRCRAIAAVVASIAAPGAVAGWLTPDGVAVMSNPQATVDQVVGAAALLSIWALLAWVVASLVLSALATAPGVGGALAARCAEAVAPRLLRRLVAVAVGAAVASGSAPALAAVPGGPTGQLPSAAATSGPAVLPGVDNPQLPSLDRPAPTPAVVVAPGDCLWSIAARHLGPTATTSGIATEWRRWYDVNRLVIGPDPDLILPGQRLTPPV